MTATPAAAREAAPYAYLDDAEGLFDTIGSSPPDDAFRIAQDDDRAWDVSGALLLAEPSGDTRRFYAFAPGDRERARRRDRSDAVGQWRAGGYRGAPPSGLAAGQATTDRADRRGSAVPGGGPAQRDRPREWPSVAAVGTDPSRAVRSPLEETRAPTEIAAPSDRNRSPRFGAQNGDPRPRHDRADIDARVAPASEPLGVGPPPRAEPNVGEPARSPDRVAAPVRRHAPSTPDGVSEAAPAPDPVASPAPALDVPPPPAASSPPPPERKATDEPIRQATV